jgi:hypothetical protein
MQNTGVFKIVLCTSDTTAVKKIERNTNKQLNTNSPVGFYCQIPAAQQ